MENPSEISANYPKPLIDGTVLKFLGLFLTVLDHIGLIFANQIPSDVVTMLRAMGRPAFPIFVFCAMEGVYHTHDYKKYFLRLFAMALLLDGVAYIVHYGFPDVGEHVVPGNVFMDLALGTLTVHLLKRNSWKSLFALFPAAYLVLSDFSLFRGMPNGFIPFGVSSDYGTLGLSLFLGFYLAYEGAIAFTKRKAKSLGLDLRYYCEQRLRLSINLFVTAALVAVIGIFTVIWHTAGNIAILPALGMPLESWSCLAGVLILLYDGRPGWRHPIARYSLYLFYPLHLAILWLVSLAFN